MTCEAIWIVASFHSISLPFIQILPVPGNPIRLAPYCDSSEAARQTQAQETQERRGASNQAEQGREVPTAPLRRMGIDPSGRGAACGSASRSAPGGLRAP